jgi:hypothetical protein
MRLGYWLGTREDGRGRGGEERGRKGEGAEEGEGEGILVRHKW